MVRNRSKHLCFFLAFLLFTAVAMLLMTCRVNAAEMTKEAPAIKGLKYESTLELQFATGFDIFYYQDGYEILDVHEDCQYLLVPEGGQIPDGLSGDMVVLQKPLDKIYMAASSSMALFDAIDSLDSIRLSGLQASDWYIDNAVQGMDKGKILFAGKYSEPDYELLLEENCNLAIESTMVLHSPKVKEMIEMMDIPVFIDRSSYESHPLGRTEWIKLYGAMMDKDQEAEAFFDEQAKVIEDLKDFPNTEKTVAFFFINAEGAAVIRKPSDYVPKMIEIAGGRYVFDNLEKEDDSKRSSVPMTIEEFYATAVDADYLVYNGTIDTPLESLEDLFAKSGLFRDFKAVKEGNVWSVGKYLYQATDIVGNLITDMNLMLTGGDESQMTFMTKVN